MRIQALPLLLPVLVPCPAGAASAPDPAALEQAWHECLRDAVAHQPAAQGRAGSQRNALDECKPREDAVVAALMAARGREDEGRAGLRSLPARARAWAASVAASVVDPVSSWIEGLRR